MRDLDNDLSDEFIKSMLQPIFLAEAFFDSGTLRFWSGIGQITYNSETFIGSGTLLSISDIVETQNLEANGVSITLTGIPTELVSIALNERYHGRIVNIYIAALSEAGLLIEPYQQFSGFMDMMEIEDNGETSTITVFCENRLIELKKAKTYYYTPEDQKRDYPGDLGLDFLPALQDKEIIWGRKSS